jgi:hypothetical protein
MFARAYLTIDPICHFVLCAFEVVARLEIYPELRRGPEVSAQSERCIGRNPSLTGHDRVNPIAGHAQRERKLIHAESERLQEFLVKDLAGMNGWYFSFFPRHVLIAPSVIIDDLNFRGAAFGPSKADPPLLIDSDAILTVSISA